jgi:hypothetical protein
MTITLCKTPLTFTTCHICGQPAVHVTTVMDGCRELAIPVCARHRGDRRAQREFACEHRNSPHFIPVKVPFGLTFQEALKICASVASPEPRRTRRRSVRNEWLSLFSPEWRAKVRAVVTRARGARA